MVFVVLFVVFVVVGFKIVRVVTGVGHSTSLTSMASAHAVDTSPSGSGTPSPSKQHSRSPSPSASPSVVEQGTGKWEYAGKPESGKTVGTSGTLYTYNVAVEGGIDIDPDEFSDFVITTLSDADRGWTSQGKFRLKPVVKSKKVTPDFTVYLASPKTRSKLCQSEDVYTSCRMGNAVVINLERWLLGVPHWTSVLHTYRQYLINHEVGHRLGYGHVVCPKKGSPSPVMAQQTLALKGCKPNAWPYRDGKYITGPPGEYQ